MIGALATLRSDPVGRNRKPLQALENMKARLTGREILEYLSTTSALKTRNRSRPLNDRQRRAGFLKELAPFLVPCPAFRAWPRNVPIVSTAVAQACCRLVRI